MRLSQLIENMFNKKEIENNIKKYAIINDNKRNLIQALRDIPRHGVKKGDYGGVVENEHNLSQEGDCWIIRGTILFNNCYIYDDALIGSPITCKNIVKIGGNSIIDYKWCRENKQENDKFEINEFEIKGDVTIVDGEIL